MKEEVYYVVDSLGVAQPEVIEKATKSLPTLFVEGGLVGMIAISLLLIALLIAAWKAPKWVKEIGIGALVFSLFWSLMGLINMCDAIQMCGDASPAILCGGFKVVMIPIVYGLIVYFISLTLRVIQKPRI